MAGAPRAATIQSGDSCSNHRLKQNKGAYTHATHAVDGAAVTGLSAALREQHSVVEDDCKPAVGSRLAALYPRLQHLLVCVAMIRMQHGGGEGEGSAEIPLQASARDGCGRSGRPGCNTQPATKRRPHNTRATMHESRRWWLWEVVGAKWSAWWAAGTHLDQIVRLVGDKLPSQSRRGAAAKDDAHKVYCTYQVRRIYPLCINMSYSGVWI